MTTPSTQFWGGDVYLSHVFPLNSDGSLKATSTAPYEGLEVDGARIFELTPAEGSYLVNIGNGRLRDTIYRAPREASRAELRVGYTQFDVIAALSGVKVYTIAEAQAVGRLTNMQGSEPDVAMVLMQRGHDENGLTRYLNYFIAKGKCIPIDSPMNDNPLEIRYTVTISNSKNEIWGEPYTLERHGYTEAGYVGLLTEGRGKIVAWLADGVEDTFEFPASKLPISAEKVSVWNFTTKNEITGGELTVAGDFTDFSISYVPDEGDLIVAKYEF